MAVESGAGAGCHFSDEQYREAGAEVVSDRMQELGKADIVLRVRAPAGRRDRPHEEGGPSTSASWTRSTSRS